jgi:hypothetical protein
LDRKVSGHRLVLAGSAPVLAMTLARNRENGPQPETPPARALSIDPAPRRTTTPESRALPAQVKLAYGATLLVVAVLFWTVVIG